MPRGDGTGPRGFGPLTGRGAGYCAGYGVPGYSNFMRRRGFSRGRPGYGPGYGWGPDFAGGWAYPPAPPADFKPDADFERRNLERHAEALEEELKLVRSRLDSLNGPAESSQ